MLLLQDLCRQHMATKSLFNRAEGQPEPSRVSSVSSQFSDAAQASPSSHSSTPSWCEEPAQANMDISTGHMILVRNGARPKVGRGQAGRRGRMSSVGQSQVVVPYRHTWRIIFGTATGWPKSGRPCVPTRQSQTPVPPPRARATSRRTAILTSCLVSEQRTSLAPPGLGAIQGYGEVLRLLVQGEWQTPGARRPFGGSAQMTTPASN